MLGHCYSCAARMNNGGTGRDALGSTQFLISEYGSVTNHKGITAVALTLAALLLACTVYTFWWGDVGSGRDAVPHPKFRRELDPFRVAPLHDAMFPNFTWGVPRTLVTVAPLYKCAADEMAVGAERACGTERSPLEVAVVGIRGVWPICTTSNNLLKRHA